MKARKLFVHKAGTFGCIFALAVGIFTLPACSSLNSNGGGGGGGGGGGSTTNSTALAVNAGPASDGVNRPLVSVTICVPGTTTCQTISDVLVDTGSVGLRLFSTQVTVALPAAMDTNGTPLGECATFADNSFLWGSVATADVKMGGEKASAVPIQVTVTAGAANFPSVPDACSSGKTDAGTVDALGTNGIIGVGLFQQDCGTGCTVSPAPNIYFDAGPTCVPAVCSPIAVALGSQLQNPVGMFTTDNNGVLISLSTVAAAGAANVSGSLIFGIGTQMNNALGAAKVYTTDPSGFITATYNSISYGQSFVDSGSNGFFFLDSPTTGLNGCSTALGFYCPASTASITVTATGLNGATTSVSFSVANFETLLTAGPTFAAFGNIGGPFPGAVDLGLPFFYGRQVFTCIEGATSPSGPGPYVAF
jgi:Protein of unknown function (DUF3443)